MMKIVQKYNPTRCSCFDVPSQPKHQSSLSRPPCAANHRQRDRKIKNEYVIDKCDNKKHSELTMCTADKSPWQVPCPALQLPASTTIHGDDWKRTEDGRLSVDEGALWEMGDDRSSLMAVWQRHKLVRTQTSKFCNFFAAVVQRDRRTAPQVRRGKELWGQW